jgi:quinol monooxygenase YgiN
MDKKKVTVHAKIKAKPGLEEKVKGELMALVGPTRSEAGCINYDLHQSLSDKTLFMFYENWTSKEDLDKHLKTPHLEAFLAKADGLLAEPIDISLWEMV